VPWFIGVNCSEDRLDIPARLTLRRGDAYRELERSLVPIGTEILPLFGERRMTRVIPVPSEVEIREIPESETESSEDFD
jgi:hypothetical protein